MKYYYCHNCEAIIADEDLRPSRRRMDECWEDVDVCPECGSDALVEAGQCKACGKPLHPRREYCISCGIELKDAFEKFVGVMMDLRMANDEELSADFMDCQDAVLEWLEDAGVL